MNQVNKHTGIRIFLLALFLGYYADITFFTHTHNINGVTIVHSHFSWPSIRKDTVPGKHQHSDKSLELIAHASTWSTLVLQQPDLPDIFPIIRLNCIIENYKPLPQTIPTDFYLRGPPSND